MMHGCVSKGNLRVGGLSAPTEKWALLLHSRPHGPLRIKVIQGITGKPEIAAEAKTPPAIASQTRIIALLTRVRSRSTRSANANALSYFRDQMQILK